MSREEEERAREEYDNFVRHINEAARRGDTAAILAAMAVSLLNVQFAQERLVAVAEADLAEEVKAAVEQRARELHEKQQEEAKSRGYIGKRKGL